MSKRRASGLTEREERFCQEYLIDLNGAQAAVRAGYGGPESSARVWASNTLKKKLVKGRVEELQAERAERTKITTDQVVKRIDEISRADVLEIFDERNCLRDVRHIPAEIRSCIASIEIEELFDYKDGEKIWTGYTKKIKFWNKPQSNDQLMRHTGGYRPTEFKGKMTLADIVAASGEDEE